MNRHTKRFIASSLIYFFAGCTLGVLGAARPDLAVYIRPGHAHLSLLGWVSMMIIGVSYFVIPVFIRKEPYSEKAITLHFILANIGITGMAVSFAMSDYSMLAPFAVIELLSAYLFLFNILSTVAKGRPVQEIPREGRFLSTEGDSEVDRWASNFTQAATIYFVIGCTLGGYMALTPAGWSYLRVHFHLNLLGWVTMMIYGVAYHIFPRFSGRPVRIASLVRTNFIIANAGLLLMAAAIVIDEKTANFIFTGYLAMFAGILEGVAGGMFVYNILPPVAGSANTMGRVPVRFVLASMAYLMMGIILGLVMTGNPDYLDKFMPVHAHINVLGWITMMIYGVGYYIIPAFAGKRLHCHRLAGVQFWIANIGLIGFLLLYPYSSVAATLFSSFEFLAAVLFIYNIAMSIAAKDVSLLSEDT